MRTPTFPIPLAGAAALVLAACAGTSRPAADSPAYRYAALTDTAVCVVDRTTDRGLRSLAAKRDPAGEVVLLLAGELRPLEQVHPVNLVAGYGGHEAWLTAGQPVAFRGGRYVRVEGERRIPLEQLERVGEHRGILLFAAPDDAARPEALYVPVRPGCIFQAYVREDLLGG